MKGIFVDSRGTLFVKKIGINSCTSEPCIDDLYRGIIELCSWPSANLKESSKSKELAEMRLQVLVVVITSDACESKKEIVRLRE